MAARTGQKVSLSFSFSSLSDHAQPQVLGQRHDSPGNRSIVWVIKHVADEGLVNLQLFKRQAPPVRQR